MDHRHVIPLSDACKMNQHTHTHTKQNNTYNNRQKRWALLHTWCVKYDEHRHDKMADKQLGQKD